MKLRALLAAGLLAGALTLPVRPADPATPTTAPVAAPLLPPNMTTYYFGLLTRGPKAAEIPKEQLPALQAGHLANIGRLAKEGKLLVAGPFMDGGDWRGIFIFKCASLEEAQALAATDPAIQAGRLKIEIHPWLTQKGNILDPEFPAPAPTTRP